MVYPMDNCLEYNNLVMDNCPEYNHCPEYNKQGLIFLHRYHKYTVTYPQWLHMISGSIRWKGMSWIIYHGRLRCPLQPQNGPFQWQMG